MNEKLTARLKQTADLLSETLTTAENIVSFYEGCLEVIAAENSLLEKENVRLKSLLKTHAPRRIASSASSWGNRWRPIS
jgi:hypothetical protein